MPTSPTSLIRATITAFPVRYTFRQVGAGSSQRHTLALKLDTGSTVSAMNIIVGNRNAIISRDWITIPAICHPESGVAVMILGSQFIVLPPQKFMVTKTTTIVSICPAGKLSAQGDFLLLCTTSPIRDAHTVSD